MKNSLNIDSYGISRNVVYVLRQDTVKSVYFLVRKTCIEHNFLRGKWVIGAMRQVLVIALWLVFQSQARAESKFQILPFFHLNNLGHYSLSWQYSAEATQHSLVKMPLCDFGNNQTYMLEGMEAPVRLKDIPCLESNQTIRFAFLADTQEGVKTSSEFLQMVDQMDNNAVIFGGDIVQTADSNQEWEDILNAAHPVISKRLMIPVVGNHEYRSDEKARSWKRIFGFDAGYAFYTTWVGPVKFIIINSCFEDDPTLVIRQLAWLDQELAKPAPWKIMVFHHPPYSRSVMYSATFPKKEYKLLRELYLPLFEKHHVNLVLNGHSHIYEHSFRNGIHYITTGAAGGKQGIKGNDNPYEVSSNDGRTYIQFEANSQELRAQAINLDSKPIDFLILKNAAQ